MTVFGSKAVIFKSRKQLFLRVPTFKTEYRFRLVAPNGEVVAQSEGYTVKRNARKVIEAYFPGFSIDDQTGEKP